MAGLYSHIGKKSIVFGPLVSQNRTQGKLPQGSIFLLIDPNDNLLRTFFVIRLSHETNNNHWTN